MDRLRHLILAALVVSAGCSDAQKATPRPATGGRAVGVQAADDTGAGFCEKTWPAGARTFARPAEHPLPDGATRVEQKGAWTWVNLWATWCVPCIEEMGLLARWHTAMEREGRPFRLELWTIDALADAAKLKARIDKGLPGPVHWLTADALKPFFMHLGVADSTPIPIHALVDPRGDLRCVRVGAIHGRDYGQVKQLLSGG